MTMTMSTRPVGSLCTHGSDLLWGPKRSCTLGHSLLGEHVRITQETIVQVFLCKPHPFGMKWPCFCAGDGEVCQKKCGVSALCVFVRVGMY